MGTPRRIFLNNMADMDVVVRIRGDKAVIKNR